MATFKDVFQIPFTYRSSTDGWKWNIERKEWRRLWSLTKNWLTHILLLVSSLLIDTLLIMAKISTGFIGNLLPSSPLPYREGIVYNCIAREKRRYSTSMIRSSSLTKNRTVLQSAINCFLFFSNKLVRRSRSAGWCACTFACSWPMKWALRRNIFDEVLKSKSLVKISLILQKINNGNFRRIDVASWTHGCYWLIDGNQ